MVNKRLLTLSFRPATEVAEAVALLKELLISGEKRNVECYGLYVPAKNKGEGLWLKEDKLIANYDLDFTDIFEFKEDERYSAIMDQAAKAFSMSPNPILIDGEVIIIKKDHVTHLIRYHQMKN
jgi:hypothetical protein